LKKLSKTYNLVYVSFTLDQTFLYGKGQSNIFNQKVHTKDHQNSLLDILDHWSN